MLYREWVSQYFTLYKRKLAPTTMASYARVSELCAPIIDQLPLDQITPDHIQTALVRVEDVAGPRQAQIAYALLHACLARAVRSRHIPYNPVDAVDKPEHQSAPGRCIPPEQWEQLLPDILDEPGLALAALAGLRRGEVLALQRRDVDLKTQLIHVHAQRLQMHGQQLVRPPKSRSGVRDVPIVPMLAEALRPTLKPLLPNALVCPCCAHTLDERWHRIQRAAGVPEPLYRLHDLRHTWASRLITAGCNPRILQYMIGHSSFALTSRAYIHIGAADALAECSRLAATFH